MANEKTPVVWDDTTNKHRPLGTGEKMGGLDASSILSSDSGNLIQTGSDGLAYLSGGSIADPRADNLLEESANGKLQVTADRIVEWLGLNPSDAEKIAEALAAKMAGELADGKTIVASGGKLTSDPTNATAAQKKAINQALADASSGLVVDNATGKLGVDFSQMPTDKFEALLAGLKMQVPLSANLSLHVDTQSAAAGDSIVDGRGTAAKPFKTIQACVTWATGYYSLGRFNVTIFVHPGNYDESVNLPTYNASSGRFFLQASDFSNPPVIRRADSSYHNGCGVTGNWILTRLKFVNYPVVPSGTSNPIYAYGLHVYNGGLANVRGCEFDMSYTGGASSYLNMTMILSEGGTIWFEPMAQHPCVFNYHKGSANSLSVIAATDNGIMSFSGSFDSSLAFDILCSGDASVFARAANQALISGRGGGSSYLHFTVASGSTCTGKLYEIRTNSGIAKPSGGVMPGDDTDCVVEAATYCWYKG